MKRNRFCLTYGELATNFYEFIRFVHEILCPTEHFLRVVCKKNLKKHRLCYKNQVPIYDDDDDDVGGGAVVDADERR